jgi:hypothetical protein
MHETIHLNLNLQTVSYGTLLVDVGKIKTTITKRAYTIQWNLVLSNCICYNTLIVKIYKDCASISQMFFVPFSEELQEK